MKYVDEISPNDENFAETFFRLQLDKWKLAQKNYDDLKHARRKVFRFGNAEIIAQFNPARAVSTFADVDAASIKKRKCFLCDENLYSEQFGLRITENFTMLVNPFPVLSRHFTIKFNKHEEQRISENFNDFLRIARLLGEEYFVLYNGPDCGASVPEHRHFQAGPASELPLVNELKNGFFEREKIKDNPDVFLPDDPLRGYFLIKSKSDAEILQYFFSLFEKLEKDYPSERETKLNLLAFWEGDDIDLVVIPRKAHRPAMFFDEKNALKISPATLDIGGVVVVPRKTDFERTNEKSIEKIFADVVFTKEELLHMMSSYDI